MSKKRKDAIYWLKEIYNFFKDNPLEEYNLTNLSNKLKIKYNTLNTCLEILKEIYLIKERTGVNHRNPERLFSFNR